MGIFFFAVLFELEFLTSIKYEYGYDSGGYNDVCDNKLLVA